MTNKLVGNIVVETHLSGGEKDLLAKMIRLFKKCPIPNEQIFSNLGLFLSSKDLSRILFMDFIYRQIVDVHGIVIEFGTRWGQNLAIFSALRGIYEPYHRHRKLVGFDTFKGFPSISERDGSSDLMKVGNISVIEDYVQYLKEIMDCHEELNPLDHIKKYELVIGDASNKIDEYLKENPETIIALAYFDFDLYEPTKKCLEAIRPHLIRGSILVFDELNDHDAPGETVALKEVFGLNNIKLQRFRHVSRASYFVVE